LLADFFGFARPKGIRLPELHTRLSYVTETMLFMTSILVISAVIVDYITRLLVEKEQQASKNLAGLKQAQEIVHLGSREWNVRTNRMVFFG
jgi:hypothetical protein